MRTSPPASIIRSLVIWAAIGLCAFFLGIKCGYVSASWHDIFFSIFQPATTLHAVIVHIRIPRLLAALVIGSGLSLSGLVYQTTLKNPLAEPYLLGVASGAACGAAIGYMFSPFLVPVCAFIGAFSILGCVLLVAKIIGRFSLLSIILSGVMCNTFFSSILLLLIRFSSTQGRSILFWLMGDIEHISYTTTAILFGMLAGAMMLYMRYAKGLDIFLLSDIEAESLGVSLSRVRLIFLCVTSFIVAVLVSCAGIIGFVGLLIPHLCKMQIGNKHRSLIPLVMVAGGVFLVMADVISNMPVWGYPLPIGLVTSLLGVPFFFIIMMRSYA